MSGAPPAGLAFVLGFARSGTTLLGRILSGVSEVVVLEEKPLLARAVAQFIDPVDGVERLAALSGDALAAYREDFWERARQTGADLAGRLVVEQTALNTVYLPLIGRLFPEARIVFAIRDPRDVVFSCFRRQFAPTPFTLEFHSLHSTARFYGETMALAKVCREKLPLTVLDLRYEDLIADFDGQTKWLCAFLGLPWSQELRDFHRTAEGVALGTRSAAQVRRGLNRDSVGHWRLYREQMAPVLPLLAPWVEAFGYDND